MAFRPGSVVGQSHILRIVFLIRRHKLSEPARLALVGTRFCRPAYQDILALCNSQRSDRRGVVYQDSDGPVSRRVDVSQGTTLAAEGAMARSDGTRPRPTLISSFNTRRLIVLFVNAASLHHQPSACIA